MNIHDLRRRLEEEGCNPMHYALGDIGGASDAFCLVQDAGQWTIFYTERGINHEPIFRSPNEEEACAFFLKQMQDMPHTHCVGFFRAEENAKELKRKLSANGIESFENHIPYRPNELRYRIFVTGKAIHAARSLLGSLPLRDEPHGT